jgi:hypothetical protein
MHIRPKVVEPFPGPYASESYMHQAVLFLILCNPIYIQNAALDLFIFFVFCLES